MLAPSLVTAQRPVLSACIAANPGRRLLRGPAQAHDQNPRRKPDYYSDPDQDHRRVIRSADDPSRFQSVGNALVQRPIWSFPRSSRWPGLMPQVLSARRADNRFVVAARGFDLPAPDDAVRAGRRHANESSRASWARPSGCRDTPADRELQAVAVGRHIQNLRALPRSSSGRVSAAPLCSRLLDVVVLCEQASKCRAHLGGLALPSCAPEDLHDRVGVCLISVHGVSTAIGSRSYGRERGASDLTSLPSVHRKSRAFG